MFSNKSSKRTETNYEIRRLAVDFGIPLITNVEVAKELGVALGKLERGDIKLEAIPLSDYYA